MTFLWYVPQLSALIVSNSNIRIRAFGTFIFSLVYLFFRIYDAGSQRAQRRKWIQFFDDINILIFIVAINEYNQIMIDDPMQVRIHVRIVNIVVESFAGVAGAVQGDNE